MADETFIDTSGFYSMLVRRDRMHGHAAEFMAQAARDRTRFVTTDYVLDESVTLLRARGHGRLVAPLFESIDASTAIRIEWTTPSTVQGNESLLSASLGQVVVLHRLPQLRGDAVARHAGSVDQ